MPKKRSPNREIAREIFEDSNGIIPLVEIAQQLGIAEGTVRAWKNKDGWERSEKRSDKTAKRSKQKLAKNPTTTQKTDNATNAKTVPKNEFSKTKNGYSQNTNAAKTGEFTKFYFADATAEDWEMLTSMENTDVLQRLQATINAQFLQERRQREFVKACEKIQA
ncbi:MAG: phage terminase small subunit-related protein [Firmicutes bacterium]|nr:phage terminase small subunit-related protein [Bacillota bacterium]